MSLCVFATPPNRRLCARSVGGGACGLSVHGRRAAGAGPADGPSVSSRKYCTSTAMLGNVHTSVDAFVRGWTFYCCIYTGSKTSEDLHSIFGGIHGITKFSGDLTKEALCIEASCTAQQSHGVVVAVHRWELTGYNLFSWIQSILLVFYCGASSCDSQVMAG